jgi:hypothetical protein
MTQPNFRDVELLSAYLDGELSQAESARLETRLKSDPQLRTIFDDISQSRSLLRRLPARRAPRNFTLTPKMAGIKPPVPRAFPIFRFASAVAAILFVFSFAVNLTAPILANTSASAPMAYGKGGGGGADPTMEAAILATAMAEGPAAAAPVAPAPTEAPAATESPALMAPAAPMPTASASAQDSSVLTPTPEAARTMASAETPTPEAAAGAAPSGEAQNQLAPTPGQAEIPAPPEQPIVASRGTQQPIPSVVLIGLLVLAVLAGIIASIIRWQADRKFAQAIKRK